MSNDVLLIGHSPVGPTMPRMLDGLLTTRSVDAQVINGAPLIYNWDHGAEAEGVNARAVLPLGGYATLILTEAVPLAGHSSGPTPMALRLIMPTLPGLRDLTRGC